MKKDLRTKRFINLLAFISILFAAVALTLSAIFNGGDSVFAQISHILSQVAYSLAFIVSGIYAFYYIRSKGLVLTIIYIVACVVVAVFLILPMFGIL